ncbi:ABC transporter ATP-binding protein/permease [Anaerolentibacter hominis]|uniref:ABC transporter ATP-binding protein/permease n=1 Tax=Anaerolentibacter hominis TaxID=3079009 RepID=UPI0031B86C44
MINKRLIGTVKESKKYIAANVALQWCSLAANIILIVTLSGFLNVLWEGRMTAGTGIRMAVVAVLVLLVRFVCTIGASRMSYLSSRSVKRTLRERIYQKLLDLGSSYTERVSTAETVQMSVEGVDQLETYFGAYLPQFFYSMLAPLTLFAVLAFLNIPSAFVLLVCVPLIPIAIAGVQTFAKRLLSNYWNQYTTLGDTFLENLQGLTTLKIYQADGLKSQEMEQESERFRKITMKVLTMQLNSITIMDLVAYGGAALGIGIAVTQFGAGRMDLTGCLIILLLAADFFLPMRQLGSFFHIAMNGMAASDKIFRLLDMEAPEKKTAEIHPEQCRISCRNVSFSYEKGREIIKEVSLDIPQGSFISIVGESGCGKSTIASILMGRNRGYSGSVTVGGTELSEIQEESRMRQITYVNHNSYLFKGTVRENLQMGNPAATEEMLWEAVRKMKLDGFLRKRRGLDTALEERGANLSGGQRQRLALARSILHDSPVYIFDEATSNIDVESENAIMEQIRRLAEEKQVLLISHRLANVTGSQLIYVMEDGRIRERGTHRELLHKKGVYAELWNTQKSLEEYEKDGDAA